jgi:hypothetical protein
MIAIAYMNQCGIVGIATSGGWMVRALNPGMGMRFFFSPKCPDWLCGPTSLLCNRYQGLFLAVKQPGGGDDYLAPFIPMSGMIGAVPLPYMPSWPGQGINLYLLYNKTYQSFLLEPEYVNKNCITFLWVFDTVLSRIENLA